MPFLADAVLHAQEAHDSLRAIVCHVKEATAKGPAATAADFSFVSAAACALAPACVDDVRTALALAGKAKCPDFPDTATLMNLIACTLVLGDAAEGRNLVTDAVSAGNLQRMATSAMQRLDAFKGQCALLIADGKDVAADDDDDDEGSGSYEEYSDGSDNSASMDESEEDSSGLCQVCTQYVVDEAVNAMYSGHASPDPFIVDGVRIVLAGCTCTL